MAKTHKSKYMIITKNNTDEVGKLYGNNLKEMKHTGKFVFRYCSPKSVCLVNMKGKVGLYLVAGMPEKTEERGAREMI